MTSWVLKRSRRVRKSFAVAGLIVLSAGLAFTVLTPFTPVQAVSMESRELATSIVQLMDKYLPQLGVTIITDEICHLVSERALREAADDLTELTPKTWTAGAGDPLAPSGSLRARFSRNAQFLRNQYLLIYTSDDHKYCEAKIENVPGL